MINRFKVGCNFDLALIDKCKELNEKYKDKGRIVEFFGSDYDHQELTARPGFRLQKITKEYFEEYIKKSLEAGIVFNYVMNSPFPYLTKEELINHKEEIQEYVKWLESIGVYRITIANPLMALIIREVSDIELEVSTILNIETVTQLKYYHDTFKINKFCCSVNKNRDFKFLKNAAKYCNENGLILENLCNEFCYVSGNDHSATACPYRQSCYMCHAGNRTKEQALLYNNYPMQYCMSSRNSVEEGWLKSRWIRPEDLHYYNDIGIDYFKVSGRTGTTEYISTVIEAYMAQKFEGNLIALWKPLESIFSEKKESEHKLVDYIPNDKLDGFLKHWVDNPTFECANEICGQTCKYCKEYYEKNIKANS